MAESDIEKILTIFHGISAGDVDLATQHIDHKRFMQHNPYAIDGVDGLVQFISQSPRDQLRLTVVRAFQDGPYVVTQAKGQRSGRNVFLDIFRFEDRLVVEHWAFSTIGAPPNRSGHTQTDGPTEVKRSEDIEKNKSIVREYYETIHVSGDHSKSPQYFRGAGHTAFFVNDLQAAAKSLRENGAELLEGPIKAKGEVKKGEEIWYFKTPWGAFMEILWRPDEVPYENHTPFRLHQPNDSWSDEG